MNWFSMGIDNLSIHTVTDFLKYIPGHFITLNILKLNYCKKVFFFLVHLFARDNLLMRKLEIKETKATAPSVQFLKVI